MTLVRDLRECDTVRSDIEEKLAALLDSQHHGKQASWFCKTHADIEFTNLIMDDLEKQITELRTQLKALGSLPEASEGTSYSR